MAVEIMDLPKGQRGIANFSPSRNCAFAVVIAIPPNNNNNEAVVMLHNQEMARFSVAYPLHVFITNDCIGVFEDDNQLVVFYSEGVLFKIAMPRGLGGLTGFKVTPDGFVITGGGFSRFVFDMTGRVIDSGKEPGFYQADGPSYLRWARYREADDLLAKGQFAKAQKLYDVCVNEFTDSPTYQATILRKLGEISLQLNNKDEAIEYWTKALTVNPKVGVKKKMEALRAGM